MKKEKRRVYALLLTVLLAILSGCAQKLPVKDTSVNRKEFDIPEHITLRVILDPSDLLVEYVKSLAVEFTGIYENVTIQVETLPSGDTSGYRENWEKVREEMLTEIYGQMQAGEGPDLFILDGGFHLEDRLFPDVNIAMRQGYFSDLNEYYMTDEALNREGLINEVMDAGVVNGARYLLPFGYEYKVACVDMERLYEAGLDSSIFDSGVISLLDAVSRLGDSNIADSTRVTSCTHLLTYFPNMLDYDAGEVLLTSGELTEFLEMVQAHTSLCTSESVGVGSLLEYYNGTHWRQQDFCMRTGLLNYTVTEEAATAKALGFDLRMFPITGAEGTLTAEIGTYGTVSANCKYPEVAYEFLRMFLLPEIMNNCYQMLSGYPVRTHNSVSAVYQNHYEDFELQINIENAATKNDDEEERQKRLEALKRVALTDSDIPILLDTIEVAQIMPRELKEELSSIIFQLNDPETGQPTDVDIEALAQGYIDYLTVYLNGQLGTE